MEVVRIIGRGEKVTDILNEAKALTFQSGNEIALVKLANGQRALVRGGPGGITWAEGEVTRIFGHTHPYVGPGGVPAPPTGPSGLDFQVLEQLKQKSSWLLERGVLTKFGL